MLEKIITTSICIQVRFKLESPAAIHGCSTIEREVQRDPVFSDLRRDFALRLERYK